MLWTAIPLAMVLCLPFPVTLLRADDSGQSFEIDDNTSPVPPDAASKQVQPERTRTPFGREPSGTRRFPGRNPRSANSAEPAGRAVPSPASQAGTGDRDGEEPTLRLSYLAATWPHVLNELAEKTGSTLVMLDTPPGRFSRQDWRKYTRAEAVRILNRELEPEGFRIVEKEQFLTVMQIKRMRQEYRRPVVPAGSADSDSAKAESVSADRPSHPRSGSPVRQAGHESPEAEAAPETPQRGRDASVVVATRHRTALDVARQIHGTFQDRSQLKNEGPHGLPAFVVDHFDPEAVAAGRPLFTVEIDGGKNELVITGPTRVQVGLRTLIQKLDIKADDPASLPTLLAGEGTTADVGRKLKRPLSQLAESRQNAASGEARTNNRSRLDVRPSTDEDASAPRLAQADQADPFGQLVQQDPSEPQPPEQAQPAQPQPEGAEEDEVRMAIGAGGVFAALQGNLKGDVTIESLPDLDLLILRGNEKDVEAVIEVIRAIEQMAEGSLPGIELFKLRFVDSRSLAELLNEVYERLSDLRSESAQRVSVRVIPVVTPNAILILAPSNAMEAILDLADELDQEVDPEHEVEVFFLKHAVATTVEQRLNEFYTEQEGLGTRIRVASDVRTNSVIVQARPRDLSEISKFIREIDKDESASVARARVFQLKSAVAEELAIFLNMAIQAVFDPRAAQMQQPGQFQQQVGLQDQDPKSMVLEFLSENKQTLLRTGLLNDIRFHADPRTNSLMVTATEQSLPLIEELIEVFDRPSPSMAEIKVYPLRNADAVDAVDLLRELFEPQQQQVTGIGAQQTAAMPFEIAGIQDSSNLIPMRFTVDFRTNSVVAIGGVDLLLVVEAILYRLDAAETRDREVTVIRLRNSFAPDVATAINQFLQSQRELFQIDPTRISTSQLLEQEIIVTAEATTNSLLISATPNYFPIIRDLAEKLDAEPPQVLIQALLVEVELTNNDEFGVELGFQDSVLFNRSVVDELITITETITAPNGVQTTTQEIISQTALPGFPFNNQPLGNNVAVSPGRVGTQGLSNFAMGRVSSDVGYGGLVLSASSESVNVLIRALAARRNLRILSRPQVLALDNQIAQIQVGQNVPVADGVSLTQQAVLPIVTRDDAGIIMTVTPRISPEGQIVMEVAAEKSQFDLVGGGVVIFTDAVTGNTVTAPVKDVTTMSTTVRVPDSQTIVIGGMITKVDDAIERKVPWLGDIPILGRAFRFDARATRRTELLIFLTPRIVHNDADAELFKAIEADRLHFFQEEAEAMHGPLFGVPEEMAFPIEEMPIETGPGMSPEFPVPPVPSGPEFHPQSAVNEDAPVIRLGDLPVE
jgi:general secretion pathway protein D